jgi:hypothetical protein
VQSPQLPWCWKLSLPVTHIKVRLLTVLGTACQALLDIERRQEL